MLYILARHNHRMLVNAHPDRVPKLKELGWEVFQIGIEHPDCMPGQIADNIELTPSFLANMSKLPRE